jgi:hypothetical protein
MARPFVSERELVMRVQDEVHLAKALRIVVIRNGQLTLTNPAENFFQAVDFDRDPDQSFDLTH